MTEQTEPTACPEAMGMTAVLLAGMRPPLPYPWTGRTVRPALDRKRSNLDDDETEPPEPPSLDSLPALVTTEEARHALGIGLTTFIRRLHGLRLKPAGRGRGRTNLWSAEQVRALASYSTDGAAAHG